MKKGEKEFVITLKKEPDREFVILNLTDLHNQQPKKRDTIIGTVTKLVERVKPDLITISGDFTDADREGADKEYEDIMSFLDGFRIPWAPIWGNHDNGEMAERYVTHKKYCLYEKGDPVFGHGNYIICIKENDKPVEAVFMLDSHRSKLRPEQIAWYHERVQELKGMGCKDTTMILHIPIYAYRQAFAEAFNGNWERKNATHEMFQQEGCWKEEYQESTGAQLEDTCCCGEDDGVLDAVLEAGTTKTIIAGHDHINNWIIHYKGIRLVYALKTGAGVSWAHGMNGGTVIKVNSEGVSEVYHEYVKAKEIKEKCALFFDIDSSMLSEKEEFLWEKTLKVLEIAKENGHLLFYYTEKSWRAVPEMIRNIPFDGFICGAEIRYCGEVICENITDRESARDFISKMVGIPTERCYIFEDIQKLGKELYEYAFI